MQEQQGPPAPRDRTRIMRFAMCQQEDAVALRCAHHRQRIFSALLPTPMVPPVTGLRRPHGRTSVVFLR